MDHHNLPNRLKATRNYQFLDNAFCPIPLYMIKKASLEYRLKNLTEKDQELRSKLEHKLVNLVDDGGYGYVKQLWAYKYYFPHRADKMLEPEERAKREKRDQIFQYFRHRGGLNSKKEPKGRSFCEIVRQFYGKEIRDKNKPSRDFWEKKVSIVFFDQPVNYMFLLTEEHINIIKEHEKKMDYNIAFRIFQRIDEENRNLLTFDELKNREIELNLVPTDGSGDFTSMGNILWEFKQSLVGSFTIKNSILVNVNELPLLKLKVISDDGRAINKKKLREFSECISPLLGKSFIFPDNTALELEHITRLNKFKDYVRQAPQPKRVEDPNKTLKDVLLEYQKRKATL